MVRTIIQPIGPLYGEVVNGTVFGRPNGSVYVPSSNTISLSKNTAQTDYVRISGNGTNIYTCNGSGVPYLERLKISAEAQDLASYIVMQISDTNEFGTVAQSSKAAGNFNMNVGVIAEGTFPDDFAIVNGTTYYIRAILMASTGAPVAYSDTLEVVGYGSE